MIKKVYRGSSRAMVVCFAIPEKKIEESDYSDEEIAVWTDRDIKRNLMLCGIEFTNQGLEKVLEGFVRDPQTRAMIEEVLKEFPIADMPTTVDKIRSAVKEHT